MIDLQFAGEGDIVADAIRKTARASLSEGHDPLARLFDPTFTETLWPYEYSRVEPEIPGQLHAKQLEVLKADARHRWMIAGNQSGKSTVGAVDVALLALGRHPYLQHWDPPITAWASAITWEMWQKILLPELLTWLPPDRVLDAPPPYQDSHKRDITVLADNGRISRITGKAAEQGAEKYQSARVHVVWLDEEHPESVWDEMQARLVRHGGLTIATMTPLKGYTWVYRRVFEPWKRGERTDHAVIRAGMADNPSIAPEAIEAIKREFAHDPAQLEARLHGSFTSPAGLALKFDPERHYETLDREAVLELVRRGYPFAGLDFGAYRFAFLLLCADRAGRAHVIEECFSQRETMEQRAESIHRILADLSIHPRISMWGDLANLQDIVELNEAFRRMGSKYHVMPVAADNKIRTVSVERLNTLLGRGALLVRRGLGERPLVGKPRPWRLGMNASHEGQLVIGSRLTWEIGAWCYPDPKDGKAQKQDPDDDSADGADMIAALRYAVMSWWKAGKKEWPELESAWSPRVLRAEDEAGRRVPARVPNLKPVRPMRKVLHPEWGEVY